MPTFELAMAALRNLLSELLEGPPGDVAFVLNPGDRGLLRSIGSLSAGQASRVPDDGGSSIAAHVDHLRYGLELLNRWAGGDQNAFADAKYAASWQRTRVSDEEWRARIDQLRQEAATWHQHLSQPRSVDETEATGAIASVVHLAYHMGAIRQIDRALKGPAARD